MLYPLESVSIPKDVYRQVFASGTTIAIEVDFARKVELANSAGAIDGNMVTLMHRVNNLRKFFAHPSKFHGKLAEFRDDRGKYKEALVELTDAHKEMNEIFEKYIPPKESGE